MTLYQLMVGLGLDTSQYDSGLSGARRKLSEFAKWAAEQTIQFGKVTLETGMGFDKQMSRVQALLGKTEGTEEHMIDLREFALDQARDSIYTSEQVGQAYEYMALAGWKYEELMEGLPGVIALAAASGEDMAMVSDMVTDSLTAFGESAEESTRFVDVLAATVTNSNTDVKQMFSTFRFLAPVAGALGISIEETALAVGLLANNGIKSTQAGTALRNILTRLSTDAGATSNSLGALGMVTDALGVTVYDENGNMRDFIDILRDLRLAWNDTSGEVRSRVAEIIGVASETDPQKVQDLTASIEELRTEWEELNTSAERAKFLEQYGEAFESLGVSIKDSYGQYKDFDTIADTALSNLTELSDAQKLTIANKVASLRALPAWLALMEGSEEDFNQLWDAIIGSEGAAQEMANVQLDNLWGDVEMLKAAFDTLKIAIYDDTKGPLRDLTQYATGALKRIEDAITENGIEGGIEQLALEITGLTDKLKPILESLGQSLVPIFTTLITNLIPSLLPFVVQVGIAFGEGIFDGISQVLMERAPTLAKLLGVGQQYEAPDYMYEIQGIRIDDEFLKTWDSQAAMQEILNANGADTITINGVEVPADVANQFVLDIDAAIANGDIGEKCVGAMQAALDEAELKTTVVVQPKWSFSGFGGFKLGDYKPDMNARAMSGGRILNHATIFGANGNGQPMIGGEAGQEAIIGTGSLSRIIKNAVNDAMMRRVPVAQPTPDVVLQMDGKTVARVQREHNASENTARVKAIALGYGR